MSGLRWLNHRSRHFFPSRPLSFSAIRVHCIDKKQSNREIEVGKNECVFRIQLV
jgi:hypothetical protein